MVLYYSLIYWSKLFTISIDTINLSYAQPILKELGLFVLWSRVEWERKKIQETFTMTQVKLQWKKGDRREKGTKRANSKKSKVNQWGSMCNTTVKK